MKAIHGLRFAFSVFVLTFNLFRVSMLPAAGDAAVADASAQPTCPTGLFGETLAQTAQNCSGTSSPSATAAASLPAGFQESVVFSGLTRPTDVRFAPDGRVFVTEQYGIIKVFPSLNATTPITFADLHTAVNSYEDRGLLGLALDPTFPANPYVYVLYTFDAPISGTAPIWNDTCPNRTDGCMVSGRLSRLTADVVNNTMLTETVLINAWCQQFTSHSIGQLAFGPDGALYASSGEGASYSTTDYGQLGNPANACGDPPAIVGVANVTPTAEGGSLRAQSLQRNPGEPALLSGTIVRIDPAMGLGLPTNPLSNSADLNAQRIVGYGMRNPFRFTFRPGTNEIWAGDVGLSLWEEIDRIVDPTATPISNFGWPCYEGGNNGSLAQPNFQAMGLILCANLYSTPGAVTAPYFAYAHHAPVFPGDSCATNTPTAITGLAFYKGSTYPRALKGGLFFADHNRKCIWVMPQGTNGLPDASRVANFVTGAANPVDLEIGPDGDLYYVDFEGGTIRRIQYVGADLGIQKSVEGATLAIGQRLTYTLAFSNTGPVTATGVYVTDQVPAEITKLSYSSDGAAITPTAGLSYTWQVDDLAPGASGVITITGIASTTMGQPSLTFTNTASITTSTPNAYGNDSASAAVTVVKAQSHITLVSQPNTVFWDQPVTFTLTLSGDAPALILPAGSLTLTLDGANVMLALGPGGITRYVTHTLSVGTHPVSATYSGDDNFGPAGMTLPGGQVVTDVPITALGAVNSGPTTLHQTTTFTATASGTHLGFSWNFGDGVTASGNLVSHTYALSGTYTAIVTATNTAGTQSALTLVRINPLRLFIPVVWKAGH